MSPNYVTIDHSKSFAGQAPWVQAKPLDQTTLPSLAAHTATVILLHGFANSGAAWLPIAKHLQTSLPYVKVILPNAPVIEVDVPVAGQPGKAELPAWWNPELAGGIRKEWQSRQGNEISTQQFHGSYKYVEELIEKEAALIGSGKVFLGGFSQGTILGLAVGLENENVGGIIALSSSLSVKDSFKDIDHPVPTTFNKRIFWAHGVADYVPIDWANQSVDYLVNLGFKKISTSDEAVPGTITFKAYEGLKHETNDEEVEDIRKWLVAVLS